MPKKLCYQRVLVQVNWRTRPELLEQVNRFASSAHKPRQEVITDAVEAYLQRNSFSAGGALLTRR